MSIIFDKNQFRSRDFLTSKLTESIANQTFTAQINWIYGVQRHISVASAFERVNACKVDFHMRIKTLRRLMHVDRIVCLL